MSSSTNDSSNDTSVPAPTATLSALPPGAHPGFVTFKRAGGQSKVVPASEVADSIKFVAGKPVVLVDAAFFDAKGQLVPEGTPSCRGYVNQYGMHGELLKNAEMDNCP